MFHQDKDYLCVSLSEDAVKAAHLKQQADALKVVNVARRDLRDIPAEETPRLVQAAVAELGVKNAEVIGTVPAGMVTTKNIEIPSLDPEEIRSIIDLQAGRHTPFSREEILIGYLQIGVFQRNYTKILLVIVNRNVIKKQLEVLENAGLKINRVLFAPEGIAQFYARALKVKDEDPPVGVIDVSRHLTEFVVEFNRTAAMCRSIPIGLGHLIKEGPAAQEKLIAEIASSVEAYESEDVSKPPESYLLTSDDAKVKDLQGPLQERLKTTVKVLPYLDHIQADQAVMLKLVSEFNDESFLNVIGVAASPAQIQVDLTPEEIKTQRSIEEKGREVLRSAIFAIVMLILVGAIFFAKIYFSNLYLEKVKKEYLRKRRAVVVLDKTAQKTRIIKDFINSRMVSLEVIAELYRLVPQEIYLQSIVLDEKGTIEIVGISESMSRVFNFVSGLEDSALFKSVKTKSTTAKKDRGRDVAAFEISFLLESAKEEEEPVDDIEAKVEEEGKDVAKEE